MPRGSRLGGSPILAKDLETLFFYHKKKRFRKGFG
jgi:hypothetical protein